jgi:hypothetical protein
MSRKHAERFLAELPYAELRELPDAATPRCFDEPELVATRDPAVHVGELLSDPPIGQALAALADRERGLLLARAQRDASERR